MDPLVSCVSGTYNRLGLLQKMVQSVRKSAERLPYEIILVDVGSTDGTREWIREQDDIVLVEHEKPQGSVIAFNDGFSRARGKNTVTLNDDIAVDGASIRTAQAVLEANPHVGQVAFAHKYQNRKGDPTMGRVQRAYGYPYAQCGMTRTWLGNLANWWGDYGLVHYGGDNHLSARIWEMGYSVEAIPGCSVIDWEFEDALRQTWSHDMRKEGGGVHPDVKLFTDTWKGRLPKPAEWIPAKVHRVLLKAQQGNLRTLRFKAMMGRGFQARTTLIKAFERYGPAKQVNQNWAMRQFGKDGDKAQQWFIDTARKFRPDLIMLQAQRPNNITAMTIRKLVDAVPTAYVFNWDADTHYPLTSFHSDVAKASHLQLLISPTLFEWYAAHGATNVGYWPIGVEKEFIEVDRYKHFKEKASLDVLFLGTLYGEDIFPEAHTRKDTVKLLHDAGNLRFRVLGGGWQKIGIETTRTLEAFGDNAVAYSKSKMALSISQTKDLWGYTSDRAYNIMATGCPLLLQEFSGMNMHGLVDGETCISWTNMPELLEKIGYYKAHPQEREAIGRAGKELLLARHTWDVRVEKLFDLLRDLGE